MFPYLNFTPFTWTVVYFVVLCDGSSMKIVLERVEQIPRTIARTHILHQKTKDPRLRQGRWSCGFT